MTKQHDRRPHGSNGEVARFYDWAGCFYPMIDLFCASARRQLIHEINRQPTGKLLEIGVGPGRHLRFYREHDITAIDCSARMVASCRRCAPSIATRHMDGEQLDYPDAWFDYVTLFHVLSVTANPTRMLAEARRVVRPGGRIFILNHETPANAWQHIDAMLIPLARWLRFRSWFRLKDIAGIERFRCRPLGLRGGFGLMNAYSLEK
jgi:phosphatidylethanolamine/phosphatidyl-N-methylethanolamine N-methyltransferase